ncbi:hypothetical protein BsWGS_24027 [Bradybaena similaris]
MSSSIYKTVSQKSPANEGVQTSSRVDAEQVDTRCGFWMWKPPCLQPMAKMTFFTASFSLAALITQTLTFYVNSQVTTLERQFGFSSYQTGIILAANDIGYLACVLFVAHIANRTNIPRSLGIAVIIYGISGIACSLPHFLYGTSINNDPTTENSNNATSNFSKQSAVFGSLCDLFNNSRDPCDIAGDPTAVQRTSQATSLKAVEISLVIIVVGMALQGIAKAPRLSFSTVYVDDNTARVNTGFYSGIMASASILGPVVAFLLGGVFSQMYVTLEATTLTPRHPKWIGAWWLGYVVFGLLSLVVSVPLFCFPRKLPSNKNTYVKEDTTARHADVAHLVHLDTQGKESGEDKAIASHTGPISGGNRFKFILKHAREFIASLHRLFTNLVYVLLLISSCCVMFYAAGNGAFFPKYLERMFHLPVHTANYVTAGLYLCTTTVGTFAGGVASRRFKMTAKTGLRFVVIMSALAVCFQLLTLIFRCQQPIVHNWPSEDNSCNSGCGCRDNSYFPVCGGDGRTYYSPCHAGCLLAEHGTYQNCSCVPGGLATAGTCDYGCSHLYGYVLIAGLRNLFVMLVVMPNLIVFIRCVPEKDRSMALAVFPFMNSLFGWLLAPIIFGNVIDHACLSWDIKCLTRGRCLLYDNDQFQVKFNGYSALGMSGSFIFILAAYLYSRWTKCLDEDVQEKVVEKRAGTTPVI